MTASEKRYFKRHYSSDKSLVTSLFDFINSLSGYDEEQVKEYFKNSKLSKNLKVYKVQLTDILLKSLVSYHNKKNIHSKIRIGLEEIDILMDKQVFEMAQNKIKRIKDICIKNEAFEYIFPILAKEQILNSFYSANFDGTKKENYQKLNSYLSSINEIFHLQHTSHQLSDQKNHILTNQLGPKKKVAYQNVLKKELEKLNDDVGSVRERYYRYHVISMIYRMVENDLGKENKYKKEQVDLLKNNPDFTSSHPKLYFASTYNYLSSCWKLRQYHTLEKGLPEVKAFIKKHPVLEPSYLFVYYLEIPVLYFNEFKGFDATFEAKVIKHIKKQKQEKDFLASLMYLHFAILHLIFENHKKVHYFLRRIRENLSTLAPAYEPLLYTIEMYSHFQSGDLAVAQNLVNAYLRKQKRNPIENDNTFNQVILFFQDLIKTKSIPERSKKATVFESTIYSQMTGSLRNLLEEYGFSVWLNSLIHKEKLKDHLIKIYRNLNKS